MSNTPLTDTRRSHPPMNFDAPAGPTPGVGPAVRTNIELLQAVEQEEHS
jgi:hypothetical protein